MIEIDSAALVMIVFACLAALVALVGIRGMRAEKRRTDAYIDSLRRIGRRCPACQPWGGYLLGKMREDGSYETITCDLCNGTGELAE